MAIARDLPTILPAIVMGQPWLQTRQAKALNTCIGISFRTGTLSDTASFLELTRQFVIDGAAIEKTGTVIDE